MQNEARAKKIESYGRAGDELDKALGTLPKKDVAL